MTSARPGDDHLTAAGSATRGDLALVLTGGGARGAYQVGVLRTLARSFLMFQPDYLQRLLKMGEDDAEARLDDLRHLLAPPSLP